MKALDTTLPAPRAERPATHLLHDEPNLRVVAFRLQEGQEVPAHRSESSVMLTVTEGEGLFRGAEGEARLAVGESVVYAPGETHSIQATGGPLRFVAVIAPRPGG
jgi:quercetin dioxygenase-like cupin family protein